MKYRFAKNSDVRNLARLHLSSGQNQEGGFMHTLGYRFLYVYYKELIKDVDSIIVVAENEDDIVIGFVSGSCDAHKRLYNLKRKKFKFIFVLIPIVIKKPRIVLSLLERNRFIRQDKGAISYGVTSGVRMEYLAWSSENRSTSSLTLLKVWNQVVFSLGYNSIRGEVDLVNKGVLNIHKFLGARVISELDTKDGRRRVIIEYSKN
jgi:hypothetical protein